MPVITPREPFPVDGRTVSVIIPVFNGLDYTRRCISALLENHCDASFELVVVDNGSSDGVERWLEEIQDRITLIQPGENLGFARANNLAAQQARGKFFLFLNNDTCPIRGWLDAMIGALVSDDKIGIVGAKLLYPQTRLVQHAGVAIEPPLAVQHVYEFFPSDHPAVMRRREFQAVTAACMLMRSDLFRILEGFEEQFVNGFEDLDLCFRARDLGYKIVYEPSAEIYHYAGMSAGRRDREVENGRLLFARWNGRITPDIEAIVTEDGYEFTREGDSATIRPRSVNLMAELAAARKSLQDGCISAALSKFRRLYYLAPHSYEAISYLERIYIKLGEWDEAWEMGQRLALFKPEAGSLLRLAECALKKGAWDLARRYADGVLDLISSADPNFPDALAIAGDAAFKSGDLTLARKNYTQGLAAEPHSTRCLVGLGASALGEGRYDEARPHFIAATESSPGNPRAKLGLGLALEGLGDREGAAKSYCQALECDPDNFGALLSAARMLTAKGDGRQALRLARDYVKRWPGDPEALALLIELQKSQGDESGMRRSEAQLKVYAPDYPMAAESGGNTV